eukprot:2672961-Rhodomonas_salina.1
MRPGTWVARSSVDWSVYRLSGPGDKESRLSPTRHWGIDLGEMMASSGGEDDESSEQQPQPRQEHQQCYIDNNNIIIIIINNNNNDPDCDGAKRVDDVLGWRLVNGGGAPGSMEKVRGEKAFQPIQVT